VELNTIGSARSQQCNAQIRSSRRLYLLRYRIGRSGINSKDWFREKQKGGKILNRENKQDSGSWDLGSKISSRAGRRCPRLFLAVLQQSPSSDLREGDFFGGRGGRGGDTSRSRIDCLLKNYTPLRMICEKKEKEEIAV
jgi:hypothetical protein